METITFKAPKGTRAGLRRVNPNISELLRQSTERIVASKAEPDSGYEKIKHLAGKFSGPKNLSYSKKYLQQYGKKNHR
jgi:hypothetical protein